MKNIAGIFTIKSFDDRGIMRKQKYSMMIQLPIDVEPDQIEFEWDDPETLTEEL